MKARAELDDALAPRVVRRTALLYGEGADASLDRPAHVRAGSALVRFGAETFAIVQDDASFLAIVEPSTAKVTSIAFPSADGVRQFDDARGNKKLKLDLEAAIVVEKTLFAFGSGSSPLRERIVRIEDGVPKILEARTLYAKLRAEKSFSGSELNVEGAALVDDDILFFQRGNGAGEAVNATARIARGALVRHLEESGPCPDLEHIVQWDLGLANGVPFTFTDGSTLPDRRVAFLACAEDSPDATRDGPVSGVALGFLDDRGRSARIAPILAENGAPLTDKAEGLAFDRADPTRAFVVIDKDDPTIPSELLEITLVPR